ncbi:hypothetical protein [Halobacillus litoralis]|uniref:hypothetical protein n=1 Tax=Halobacillus litoralis TaxID=45668 RepID=UPI001CFE2698|nr:hypothetical protein [Halobacillus litoralis]
MKKIIVLLLLFVVGCTLSNDKVIAFKGPITSVKIGGIEVGCSSAVNKNAADTSTDQRWSCLVLVPQDTPVHTKKGKQIDIHAFREQAREHDLLQVKVTLSESREISEDPDSRKLKAAEITLLE